MKTFLFCILLLTSACAQKELAQENSIYGNWIIQSQTCNDVPQPLFKDTLTINQDGTSSEHHEYYENGTLKKITVSYNHDLNDGEILFNPTNVQCNWSPCPTLTEITSEGAVSNTLQQSVNTAMEMTSTYSDSTVCVSKLVR